MNNPKYVSDWVAMGLMLVAFACGWFSRPACADDYVQNKNKVIKAEAQRRAETSTGLTVHQHMRNVSKEIRHMNIKSYTNKATKHKLEEIEK